MKTNGSTKIFASFALAMLCSATLVTSAIAPAEALAHQVPVVQSQA